MTPDGKRAAAGIWSGTIAPGISPQVDTPTLLNMAGWGVSDVPNISFVEADPAIVDNFTYRMNDPRIRAQKPY